MNTNIGWGAHLWRNQAWLAAGLVGLLLLAIGFGAGPHQSSPGFPRASGDIPTLSQPAGNQSRIKRDYTRLPLSFVQNAGQADERVALYARGAGFGFYFTKEKAVLAFEKKGRGHALGLRFVGANPRPEIIGARAGRARVNYLSGSASARRTTGLRTYGEVRYRDLWPGIDMTFRGKDGGLDYEFELSPGARVSDIRLAYEGARNLTVAKSGRLLVHTPLGTLTDKKPRSFQRIGGRRVRLDTRFVVHEKPSSARTFGFEVPGHDPGRPLLIDPRLAYTTYLGGTDSSTDSFTSDDANAIVADSAGNAYVTGHTSTIDFPTTPGAFDTSPDSGDAFVTKLDSTGSEAVYSTYLGGQGWDFGVGIAVDGAGNAYVTGSTGSTDFPTTAGSFDTTLSTPGTDAFVTKLNPSGSGILYSTFIGGGFDERTSAMAVDSSGNAYVTGQTDSTNFPTTVGAFDTSFQTHGTDSDIFVTKLNSAGSGLAYSTYLGANADDSSHGIAVDDAGAAYLTGSTVNGFFDPPNDFPTTAGAFSTTPGGAFVTKLNAAGSGLDYSTYLGTSKQDSGNAIAVDDDGLAYVTGSTQGGGFPTTTGALKTTTNPSVGSAFVTKLNASGSGLAYSTFLGGTGGESGSGIAVDASESAWISGYTTSEDFPTTPGVVYPGQGGSYDGFAARLDGTGSSLLYATYLGGSGVDWANALALDSAGNAYVAGSARSSGMATEDAFDSRDDTRDGEGFVTKILVAPPPATLTLSPGSATNGLDAEHCLTATATEAGGDPSAGVAVKFTISGTFDKTRVRGTGLDGKARICYSTAAAGTDTIVAFADTNRSGSKDTEEPAATATATWIPSSGAPRTIVVDRDDRVSDADGCGGGPAPAEDPCNDIQAGVDAASPGDIVDVQLSDKVYPGGVTLNKAGLQLRGPQAGVAAYFRSSEPDPSEEAIVNDVGTADAAIEIAAPGVTIDGLAVLDTYAGEDSAPVAIVVGEVGGTVANSVFRGNASGVLLSANRGRASGNAFYQTVPGYSNAPAVAAYAPISDLQVTDNVFDAVTDKSIYLRRTRDIVIGENLVLSEGQTDGGGITLDTVANALVRGNVLLGVDEVAIELFGANGVSIAGNLIAESNFAGIQFARGFTEPEAVLNQNVTITGNDLTLNGTASYSRGGIRVAPASFSDTLAVVANRIVDNFQGQTPVGINAEAPQSGGIDARNNWWGCNEGPADPFCDSVAGSVDVDPWLSLSVRGNPTEVGVPGSSLLTSGVLFNSAQVAAPVEAFPPVFIDLENVSGPGTLSSSQLIASAGFGTATLAASTAGTAVVRASLDYADVRGAVRFTAGQSRSSGAVRDLTVPVFRRASMKPSSFAVNRFGSAEKLLSSRAKIGTEFRYALSEGATVTFTIQRRLAGRKVGRKCRRPTSKNRGRRRCARYVAVGRFAARSRAGSNTKAFSGKIGRKALSPGRYRATLVATDGAGNRSKEKRLAFRVVRR